MPPKLSRLCVRSFFNGGAEAASSCTAAGAVWDPVPLMDADEVFLTGTSAEVAWVSELDGHNFAHHETTREIAMLYQDVVHGRAAQHHGWLTWI